MHGPLNVKIIAHVYSINFLMFLNSKDKWNCPWWTCYIQTYVKLYMFKSTD